ncbi:MAG: hydrolase [Alphaproteobacteria bacterium]|jgi:2-keto-4-pentenoate hydratase/2-oxohepta-3-ene-1,7-dioic acid hydratase in catechol pathway|nr:hydrolase [Alphaproteobacteria bacterium]PPR13752.1 MAG: Ureidoglycolate lyase [Alphaproteobacteria bacterium MarineAlpha12_Bin1]|tara:strand:- start:3225 stop:4121 length:897 start_codon:yes stop_codon:yes gene_type:complete
MRLATYTYNGQLSFGAIEQQSKTIIDFNRLSPNLPNNMTDFISLGSDGMALAKKHLKAAEQNSKIKLSSVNLCAPVLPLVRDPFAVGRNYHEHAQEFHDSGFDATSGKNAVPDYPIIFTKATTSVSGPFDSIPANLDPTSSTDYEGELAVIIGRGGRGIKKEDAYDHVFGYTVSNDVTARKLQHQHKQWTIGKGLDGYCPMGPSILTSDEIKDPSKLHLQTWVNGELRQDAKVSELIFDIPVLIETISQGITLLPGDIILTGTPVGVGIGFEPPSFLKSGDIIKITIDPIGTIENKVV